MDYSKIYPFWDKLNNIEKTKISNSCYVESYDKGKSVVPILQSICRWSDIFYKEDIENTMTQYKPFVC